MWLFEYSEGFLMTIPEKQYHPYSDSFYNF